MTKLYRPFLSPRVYLGMIPPVNRMYEAFSSPADEYIYTQLIIGDHCLLDPKQNSFNEMAREQFIGALQPIFDMTQDAIKTFQPYRSRVHFIRDMLQPLRGLGNIIRGLATLAMGAFFLSISVPAMLILFPIAGDIGRTGRIPYFMLGLPSSWMINGLLQVVRGAAQVVTAPLTWLLKMPLRAILTSKFGYRKVTERAGIKKLYALATRQPINNEPIYVKKMIHKKLYEKFCKAEQEGSTLPAGLNLDAGSNFKNFCYEFALIEADVKFLRDCVPEATKPYLRAGSFKQLPKNNRDSLLLKVRKIMDDADIIELEKQQRIVAIFQEYDVYDSEMLTQLVWKNSTCGFHDVPKDVLKMISLFTVKQPNAKVRKDNNAKANTNHSEKTPLLQVNP